MTINQVIKRTDTTFFPNTFIINGQSINDKTLIANKVNEYFANIAKNMASNIVTNTTYRDYLKPLSSVRPSLL